MNSSVNFVSPEWAAFRRAFYFVAALLGALLLLLWLTGHGPGGAACAVPLQSKAESASASTTTAAPTAPATVASAVAAAPAAAVSGLPAAKIYFERNKYALPADTAQTLSAVVAHLKKSDAAKARVMGFHDPAGNAAHNADLARNRARAVRAALQEQGIARERIVMDKPAETLGTGRPEEARRVEVHVE